LDFEIKWMATDDCRNPDGEVSLTSRNLFHIQPDSFYREIADEDTQGIGCRREVVVSIRMESPFSVVAEYRRPGGNICSICFDIVWFEGRDVTELPLLERNSYLSEISEVDNVRLSDM